jgi:hypothetical protein
MTLAAEIFGSLCIIAGFFLVLQPGGLGIGVCGAVILGMALAGAFQ